MKQSWTSLWGVLHAEIVKRQIKYLLSSCAWNLDIFHKLYWSFWVLHSHKIKVILKDNQFLHVVTRLSFLNFIYFLQHMTKTMVMVRHLKGGWLLPLNICVFVKYIYLLLFSVVHGPVQSRQIVVIISTSQLFGIMLIYSGIVQFRRELLWCCFSSISIWERPVSLPVCVECLPSLKRVGDCWGCSSVVSDAESWLSQSWLVKTCLLTSEPAAKSFPAGSYQLSFLLWLTGILKRSLLLRDCLRALQITAFPSSVCIFSIIPGTNNQIDANQRSKINQTEASELNEEPLFSI